MTKNCLGTTPDISEGNVIDHLRMSEMNSTRPGKHFSYPKHVHMLIGYLEISTEKHLIRTKKSWNDFFRLYEVSFSWYFEESKDHMYMFGVWKMFPGLVEFISDIFRWQITFPVNISGVFLRQFFLNFRNFWLKCHIHRPEMADNKIGYLNWWNWASSTS